MLKAPIPIRGEHIIQRFTESSKLTLSVNNTIDLFCTDKFVDYDVNLLTAKCDKDKSFEVSAISVPPVKVLWDDLQCNFQTMVARLSRRAENETFVTGQFGFEVTPTRFVQIYEILFNKATESAYYAHHQMYPSITALPQCRDKINFGQDCFSPVPDCDVLYNKTVQKEHICGHLGFPVFGDECNKYFLTDTLSRGHLAANADFTFKLQRQTTFKYCNVVPQWASSNNGNWGTIEVAVRTFAVTRGLNLELYTGGYRNLQLKNAEGVLTDIYLNFDGPFHQVPLYVYKVVINELANTGIVFVVINNPKVTNDEVSKLKQICTDKLQISNWFKGKQYRNLLKINLGYIFACEVAEFMNVVKYLPHEIRDKTYRGLLKA